MSVLCAVLCCVLCAVCLLCVCCVSVCLCAGGALCEELCATLLGEARVTAVERTEDRCGSGARKRVQRAGADSETEASKRRRKKSRDEREERRSNRSCAIIMRVFNTSCVTYYVNTYDTIKRGIT
jgi:hypothetical protein